MAKKRIERCWPASVGRRQHFLKPRDYTHRGGPTAKQILTRAAQRLRGLIARVEARRNSIWSSGEEDALQVPARAEDLLYLLAHEQLMAQRRRGVRVPAVAAQYDATNEEAGRAVAEVGKHLLLAKRHLDTHNVSLTHALAALDDARHSVEPEPIIQ